MPHVNVYMGINKHISKKLSLAKLL